MKQALTTVEIKNLIYNVRGKAVMLDRELARLYGVTTGNFNKAVKRNLKRFPADFMFQLTQEEYENLRFQIGISRRHGGRRYMPYVFTEQGVSMLSAVLNSPKAVEISIYIMRAFVKLRTILAENEALRYAIEGLERRVGKNERDIQIAIEAIQQILEPPPDKKKKIPMGFVRGKK